MLTLFTPRASPVSPHPQPLLLCPPNSTTNPLVFSILLTNDDVVTPTAAQATSCSVESFEGSTAPREPVSGSHIPPSRCSLRGEDAKTISEPRKKKPTFIPLCLTDDVELHQGDAASYTGTPARHAPLAPMTRRVQRRNYCTPGIPPSPTPPSSLSLSHLSAFQIPE